MSTAKITSSQPFRNDRLLAEYPLNRHQNIRVELVTRHGNAVVSLSRWKSTAEGSKRTGQNFEFGAHRLGAVLQLLSEAQARLEVGQLSADQAPALNIASLLSQGSAR